MKFTDYFLDKGLNMELTEEFNIDITGLSSLDEDTINQVLQYAKENKDQVVFELLWNQATKLADWIDDPGSDIPWQERAARVPELQEMSLKIGEFEKLNRSVTKT